ncbi:hypothetical protein PV08_09802 [Exophiala spinifera]|uniref:Uncharacterized protein n=1 Tax=Exophiala spinifera TaxID=91928 RepID=A0A0D2B1N7_9EURO|nr:uncharacterized protein PV08_09802 [Exophiala spinifera]KIW12525.1 hypothetical protein PV08_09802 [Exophiala spinifera]
MTWALWESVHNWSPFEIDALGLVTLLGADEVNGAVGRLVKNAYLEYLPILGAFVIAGNQITNKAAGWHLYNISQGIHTTDLSAWLTRWMLSQDFETTRSFVIWKVTPPRSKWKDTIIALLISLIFNGFLIALTILSKDWYGFANALAMDISILVRVYVVGQQRAGVDARIDEVVKKAKSAPPEGTYEAARRAWLLQLDAKRREKEQSKRKGWSHSPGQHTNGGVIGRLGASRQDSIPPKHAEQQARALSPEAPIKHPRFDPSNFKDPDYEWTGTPTKVLIIQTDSKAVTFWMPQELLFPPSLFVEGPSLLHPRMYFVIRSIGWLAFAVHIVAIGMADLASQLYTVVLIVLPTLLLVLKFSCDDSRWVSTLQAWARKYLYRGLAGSERQSLADENASSSEPVTLRECWIGSRLKAEICEWPASYEFIETAPSTWSSGPPPKGRERSTRRQDLYAWLALSSAEEESMDKWDLFPHIRDDNTTWWQTYKKKKYCLKRNPTFGPQLKSDKASTADTTDDVPTSIFQTGRTKTVNFAVHTSDIHHHVQARKSSTVVSNSSAFPAISDHEHPQNVLNDTDAALTQSPTDGRGELPSAKASDTISTAASDPRPSSTGLKED